MNDRPVLTYYYTHTNHHHHQQSRLVVDSWTSSLACENQSCVEVNVHVWSVKCCTCCLRLAPFLIAVSVLRVLCVGLLLMAFVVKSIGPMETTIPQSQLFLHWPSWWKVKGSFFKCNPSVALTSQTCLNVKTVPTIVRSVGDEWGASMPSAVMTSLASNRTRRFPTAAPPICGWAMTDTSLYCGFSAGRHAERKLCLIRWQLRSEDKGWIKFRVRQVSLVRLRLG